MTGKWTAEEIHDQHGRTAIVTGANSGLGCIVARELARRGAKVIVASRDKAKGAEAARAITAAYPSSTVEAAQLDLANLSSIRAFADRIRAGNDHIDLLINNAGVMAAPYRRTADGFELQFGTNHLGHFALTGLILPLLYEPRDARVVTVSSNNHKAGQMRFDDLQGERRYSRWGAYAQSKLANLLFAFELDRRLKGRGWRLISVAAHPGYSATNLQLSGPPPYERLVMRLSNRLFAQSAEMGALPLLYAATAPDLPGGSHVGPDGAGEIRGYPVLVEATKRANDEDAARRLWEISERLTGVVYDFSAK
ncbi:MAG TPA: oxidoreductase [Candidatus Dormibacteraeota bacterium]|nr:oxidoreductase [Candidatus Dormibacteraeota bacterium]